MSIRDFLDRKNVIAVVGVSRNREKWGYKLYSFFKGYYRKVYAINPNAKEIDGDKAYPNLSSLPEVPDVVDIVVPAKVARSVVREAVRMGVKMIWFQPGSDDEEAIGICREAGVTAVWGRCLMETISSKGDEDIR